MSKSARFTVEFDTMAKPKNNVESDSQSDVFIDAARALECDESEERFDAAPKKIAAHKPPKDSETDSPKSEAKQSKETR
jgi:hypothetical protein